jgi:hypothetical protein
MCGELQCYRVIIGFSIRYCLQADERRRYQRCESSRGAQSARDAPPLPFMRRHTSGAWHRTRRSSIPDALTLNAVMQTRTATPNLDLSERRHDKPILNVTIRTDKMATTIPGDLAWEITSAYTRLAWRGILRIGD